MKPFNFDGRCLPGSLSQSGYVHLRNALNNQFLAFAKEQLSALINYDADLRNHYIGQKKRQYLFKFPDSECVSEFRRFVSLLLGQRISAELLTISERHFKIYSHAAPPYPPLHKDRIASDIAICMPLQVPHKSELILLSSDRNDINAGNRAEYLADIDTRELLRSSAKLAPVILDVQPSDVVVFLGNRIFHERIQAAGTNVLFIKMSCNNADPLHENVV